MRTQHLARGRRRPSSRAAAALVLLGLSGARVACAADAAQVAQVVVREFKYQPAVLSIKAGTTVTWTNKDEEAHTIRSDSKLFASGALDTDESYSFRFDKPGTYRYACSMHSRMTGTIVVQ